MTDILLGVVRQITPRLTVRQDGGLTDIPVIPRSNEQFVQGDRVLLEKVGKQIYVLGTRLPDAQSDWTPLALNGTNAVNQDGVTTWDPGMYIKIGGVVYLRGLLRANAALVGTNSIFTMPAGFRQSGQVAARSGLWTCVAFPSGTPFRLYMDAAGVVSVNEAVALNQNFALNHISYPADS